MAEELDVKSLAIALAATCGLFALVLGLLATYADYGVAVVELASSIYIGYEATLTGTLIGTVWAVVDGAIGGALIAYLYNWAQDSDF